ncbi:lactoylglutathione lyase GLO1 [Ascoidea rubescens DSM 1968]|uniref:Lactoylglutathione lyase n=1 Tax=Ascoidea rubescens DSM 1968 TaxID=1344418 RepID=A0A1D2VBA0_9ASCO|nr:glyoxalase I [Ascoidea rubescens DSM 1968]ODV58974.1 glyoxalase I [Ascoidea rubescens DSM 1968]
MPVTFDDSFALNHTCLRIKDPSVSLPFYRDTFGLDLVSTFPFPEKSFTLYMLAFNRPALKAYNQNWAKKDGVLELTHNHGTELDPNYSLNNGNVEPHRGFGHICFSVNDLVKTCSYLQQFPNKYKFKKTLSDGNQRDIAFLLDPDGYWIELIQNYKVSPFDQLSTNLTPSAPIELDISSNYLFNHTMIRVKDPKASLHFYQNVLGFKLLSTKSFESAKFTLYFLGYHHSKDTPLPLTKDLQSSRQSILELTHNWGTESDPNFKGYHNGNDPPQGYGHIGISMDDPQSYCRQLSETFPNLTWSLQYNKGFIKNIAFIKDPDNYSIEIFPNTLFESHL